MQIKTIEKKIVTKLEEWIKSISDPALRDELRKNILVSGGSITSMLLNEPVNDYDIYLMEMDVLKRLVIYYIEPYKAEIMLMDGRSQESLLSDLKKQYNETDENKIHNAYAIAIKNLKPNQIKLFFNSLSGIKVNQDEPLESLNYAPLFFSPNAISLSNELQIVIRFNGNAEQVHKTFDFIHATNYFTYSEGMVRNLPAMESIITKQLRYQGSLYPVTSIIRAKKFVKRGWNITAGELLKIMFQISQLDLSNPNILEEQLIGIDVAYFEVLIKALRAKYESESDFKMTTEYFNVIIDKIFNENESEQ